MTPVHTTIAKARPIIAAALEAGELKGGSYYRAPRIGRGGVSYSATACSIGHLYPESDRQRLEEDTTTYALAYDLILRGDLVVPEGEKLWFVAIQIATDSHPIDLRPEAKVEFLALLNGPEADLLDWAYRHEPARMELAGYVF